MKKIISILLCACLMATISIAAYADGTINNNIYDFIKADYCYLTGLSENEAKAVFDKIQTENMAAILQYVETTYTELENNDFEQNLIYIQENYEGIVEGLSEEYKEKIDSYILYIALQYYEDNYDGLSERAPKEVVVNEDDIIPVTESLIDTVDLANEPAPAFDGYVNMRVFSDPNGRIGLSGGFTYESGAHSWIVVYNNSGGDITVGRMTIANGTEIAIGTWGNQYVNNANVYHYGVWYNLEPYMAKYEGAYADNVSKNRQLTEADLATLNNYINSHDTWSATTNCSTFAAGAWNAVAGYNQLSAGIINTPKNLANSIINTTVYTDDLTMRYYYRVHYSNGSGAPIMSTRFTNTY